MSIIYAGSLNVIVLALLVSGLSGKIISELRNRSDGAPSITPNTERLGELCLSIDP